jgi:hypothetical protein
MRTIDTAFQWLLALIASGAFGYAVSTEIQQQAARDSLQHSGTQTYVRVIR